LAIDWMVSDIVHGCPEVALMLSIDEMSSRARSAGGAVGIHPAEAVRGFPPPAISSSNFHWGETRPRPTRGSNSGSDSRREGAIPRLCRCLCLRRVNPRPEAVYSHVWAGGIPLAAHWHGDAPRKRKPHPGS
jgi:hypothetical protein